MMIRLKLEKEMSSDNSYEMWIPLGHSQRDIQTSMQQPYSYTLKCRCGHPRVDPGAALACKANTPNRSRENVHPRKTFHFRQIPPAEVVVARHPLPDEDKSVLLPWSMLTSSQRMLEQSKKYRSNASQTVAKSKIKKQLVCVRTMVCVVFALCTCSNNCCTCGQASARHINGATQHASSA